MLRSSRYKFIFVHAPKNAGSSVAGQLIPYADYRPFKIFTTPMRKIGFPINLGAEPLAAHSTALEIKNLLGNSFHDYFSFGFSRDPYDRLLSRFFYSKYTKVRNPYLSLFKNCPTVNDYVSNVLGTTHFPKKQVDYFYDHQSKLLVDYVGKVEQMKLSLEYISAKIGLNIPYSHVNKSRNKSAYDALSTSSIDKINKYFMLDFTEFGYSML